MAGCATSKVSGTGLAKEEDGTVPVEKISASTISAQAAGESTRQGSVSSATDTSGKAAKAVGTAPSGIAVKSRGDVQSIAISGPDYGLGAEDVIKVSVWENKELTLDLVVRPDGMISMPLIQDVIVDGLTTAELARQIREKLSAFISDPEVSVIVLQVNAPKYYVVGSVAKPGTYPLRSETSVLQALALSFVH